MQAMLISGAPERNIVEQYRSTSKGSVGRGHGTPSAGGTGLRPLSAYSNTSSGSGQRRATTPSRPRTAQGSRPSSAKKVVNPLGPNSHSQRIAELCCVQFRFQQELKSNKPLVKRKVVLAPVSDEQEKAQAMYQALPAALRPSADEVEAEISSTSVSAPEAVVALLLGRPALANFQRALAQFQAHLDHGLVDLKVWMSAARGDLLVASVGSDFASRVLAAIALLHGTENIMAIDASELQLEEVPITLGLFTGVRYLNLSRNKPLWNLTGLRACESLQAVDLTDCVHLEDVRFLGTLPKLEVVLLARCGSLEDIRPLLLCGQRPEKCDALEMEVLAPRREYRGVRQMWPLTTHIPMGHPSLRWLVLDGCSRLRLGVASLRLCGALTYVDLFGCSGVDAMDCYFLEQQAIKERSSRWTLVWPDADKIQGLASEQQWPDDLLTAVFQAASAAAAEKMALARGGFMPPVKTEDGVFRLPRPLERTWRSAMASAHRAALEFGVEFAVPKAEAAGSSEGV
mmetsp:Transcript_58093/g.138201  ORF Transcript_58093/g.138201 Transcript_58093/m.138201 type:complete len:514 (-) Transcript_58093:60-1601(-)